MSDDHLCPPNRMPTTYKTLVLDSYSCFVLVKREGSKVSFPDVKCPEIPHRGRLMSESFSHALEELTGIRYRLVFLYATINDTFQRHLQGPHKAMFQCIAPLKEQKGRDPLPIRPKSKEYEWMEYQLIIDLIREGSLHMSHIFDAMALGAIRRMFTETFSEKGPRPWEIGSWFMDTCEEASSILRDMGRELNGDFEQYQISPSAAVLRANTNKGRVYLKANTKKEVKAFEIASQFAPFLVPRPLYVNVEKEWILMDDYGPTLDEKLSGKHFHNIILLYGKLQVESVQHVSELIEADVPKMGPECIMLRTKKMLDDPDVCEAFVKIHELAPPDEAGIVDPKKCCGTVSNFLNNLYNGNRVPLALVHGDLYDENMIRTEGDPSGYVLYDWGSARIDVPFSNVMTLDAEINGGGQGEEGAVDSYLGLWTEYGSLSELRKLCDHVDAKDDLLTVLEIFEYASEERLHPSLEGDDMTLLYDTLRKIQRLNSTSKHATE